MRTTNIIFGTIALFIIVVGCMFAFAKSLGVSPIPDGYNEFGGSYVVKDKCIISHKESLPTTYNTIISNGNVIITPIYNSREVCDSNIKDTVLISN